MATQFVNQSEGTVTLGGTEFNFNSNSVTAELFDNESVTLVKTQLPALVISGGTIEYTIVITNLTLSALTGFEFSDTIPTGLTYKTGTFKINGVSATPTTSGQDISYNFTTLLVGVTTITFTCDVA